MRCHCLISPHAKAWAGAATVALVLSVACNRIPNASREPASQYAPGDTHPFRIFSFAPSFNPMPRDTVELLGIRVCTLWVDGALDTAYRDSIVMRTVPLRDTVIEVSGACHGRARFERADFAYRGGILSDIMTVVNCDTGGFASSLLRSYISAAALAQMDGVLEYDLLAEPLKDSMVAAFNSMKDALDFAKRYSKSLKALIGRAQDTSRTLAEILDYSYKTERAFDDFTYLRSKGVFVDDEGTLKGGGLTFAEQQSVKWLNILLLTTAVYRDAFLGRNVSTRRVSPRRTTLSRISATGDEQWVVRYFERSDSAIYQWAYEDARGMHAVAESLVMDCYYRSDREYSASLLFWSPLAGVSYHSGSVVGPVNRAIIRNAALPGEEDDFRWDLYYSWYGTVERGGALARLDGSVMMLQTMGMLREANTVIRQSIRSAFRIAELDGTETVRTENIDVEAEQ